MSDAYAFEQRAASTISESFTVVSVGGDLLPEQLRVVDRVRVGLVPLRECPFASRDGGTTTATDLGRLRGVGGDARLAASVTSAALGQRRNRTPRLIAHRSRRDDPRQPARSVLGAAWLEVSGITEGAAFHPVDRHGHTGPTRLSASAVALVFKRHAARIGLDPGEVAGHSLRAGLATSAAAAGSPSASSPSRPGHKDTAMLRHYIREGSLFRENAASAVGL